jgi:signal transduction histidine kinase
MRRIGWALAAILIVMSAVATSASAETSAMADPRVAALVRHLKDRALGATKTKVVAYGQDALLLKGRERLRRLYLVAETLMEGDFGDDAKAWMRRITDIARSEHDSRYLKLVEIVGNDRFDDQKWSAWLYARAIHDPDPIVRSVAESTAAGIAAWNDDTANALRMLEQARGFVATYDPDRAIALAYNWESASYALMNLRDLEDGVRAIEQAEAYRATLKAPNMSTRALATLADTGWQTRDEPLARASLTAIQVVDLGNDPTQKSFGTVVVCMDFENAFSTAQAILNCARGLDLDRLEPGSEQAKVLTHIVRAAAKLNRMDEARASMARLDRMFPQGASPDDVPTLMLAQGWLYAREGRAVDAAVLFDKYRNAFQAAVAMDAARATQQLTTTLQHDLDLARRNEQQQHTIILFQWVMAAAAALICTAAIAILMWQRRLNAELRVARQRAEEVNALKSQFLANVSHEVRTPLNGVLGMIQAMAADELNPVQRERQEVLRGSSRGMLTILNDLLDLAKIEAGKLTLETVEFDLVPVVEGSRHAFWAAAQAKGLALDLTVEDDARGLYRGDPTRLRQVVDNLVSNAIKFTAEGGVYVTFAATGGGTGLRLSVRDTGIGMTAEAAGKIFAKFEQADASTTRKCGGTGLGLSICRELVHAFGGEISVTSTPGQGTVFAAELPLPRIGDSPAAGMEPDGAEAAGLEDAGEGLRILAAEDHPVNQLVLRTLLSQLGCEVTLVGGGGGADADGGPDGQCHAGPDRRIPGGGLRRPCVQTHRRRGVAGRAEPGAGGL